MSSVALPNMTLSSIRLCAFLATASFQIAWAEMSPGSFSSPGTKNAEFMAFSPGHAAAVDLELRDSCRLAMEAKKKSLKVMEEAELACKRARISLQHSSQPLRRATSMVELRNQIGPVATPQPLPDLWVEFREGDKLEMSYPVCPDPSDSDAWIAGGACRSDKSKIISRFGDLSDLDARMRDLESKLSSKNARAM